jgi:hypothetical protein
MYVYIYKHRVVWRGLKNMALPEAFLSVNEMGFRGGLERSMMSTTRKKEVAVQVHVYIYIYMYIYIHTYIHSEAGLKDY